MSLNSKEVSALIKVTDFPSRNEIISYFKSFLSSKTSPNDYKIINKSNQILFEIKDHNLAYQITENLNKKIMDNPLYSNTECSLSFKKLQKSSSALNISNIKKNYINFKPKIHSRNLINDNKNNFVPLHKNFSFISDYERKHWAKIRDKAGIIENDSPYMDSLFKEYIEKKKNEKKWINKKNFNVFIGKATSVNNSSYNEIKNYVGRTPSLPPLLYQFRQPQKKKWVGNGDFNLY